MDRTRERALALRRHVGSDEVVDLDPEKRCDLLQPRESRGARASYDAIKLRATDASEVRSQLER